MKMRKNIELIAILMVLLAACLFTACDGGAMEELWKDELGNGSGNGGDGPTLPPAPTPTTVAVESVSLDKAALVLKTGTDGTLTATVLPENATDRSVTWSSDNEAVATVDQNGKVTGEAAGTATIIVKTNDGAKTAACGVTVADVVYTVSFNLNGKNGTAPEDQYVLPDGKITKPTDPTAEGFKFKYWYKDTETEEWNFDTDTVTADMTLYAKWVNVYKVSFVGNNGGSDTMDPVYVEAGTSYTIPASTFTGPTIGSLPDGVVSDKKIFTGWNTAADGTGTAYAVNAEIPKANVILYAQWAKPYFSVSDTKKVYFAKGNLQYQASSGTWQFADNQYAFIGNAAGNTTADETVRATQSAWIDLFGWGATGYQDTRTASSGYQTNFMPYSCSKTAVVDTHPAYNINRFGYGPNGVDTNEYGLSVDSKSDWGCNVITNGGNTANIWRTLTKDEWTYLFNGRTVNGGIGNGKTWSPNITYGGKMGLVLYPDSYTGSALSGTVDTLPEGVVFLPAAGSRLGSSVSDVGNSGRYWMSTRSGVAGAGYIMNFTSSNAGWKGSDSCVGNPVRLVCEE